MKTHLSENSLKVITLLTLVIVTFSRPVTGQPKNQMAVTPIDKVLYQMDAVFETIDQSMKYAAPEYTIKEKEAVTAIAKLDLFTSRLDESLKYTTPVIYEDISIQNLEEITTDAITALKYQAPANTEETSETPQAMYQSNAKRKNTPVKIEVYTPSNQWLINAGYLKSERTPAWKKVKKAFGSKATQSEYANGF